MDDLAPEEQTVPQIPHTPPKKQKFDAIAYNVNDYHLFSVELSPALC